MALQPTQICNWTDIAAEVAAGRMAWGPNGVPTGSNDITFAQFQFYVQNDGTNPAGIAATACPNYNQLLPRVTTIQAPASATLTPGPHRGTGSWTAPSGGLAPTSYDYQYYANGAPIGAQGNTAGLAAPLQAYTTGDLASIWVRGVNGTSAGPWTLSNQATVT